MNAGGVRSDFSGDADVTYGEAFTVQPFGNSLVTLTLTGEQLLTMLKQQWCEQTGSRVLAPSATVRYTWDRSVAASIVGEPCASAPNPVSDLTIDGVAVQPQQPYRITVNSFLADGGDRFSVLREGTERTGGALDLDALEAHLAPSLTGMPIAVPAQDRISRVE